MPMRNRCHATRRALTCRALALSLAIAVLAVAGCNRERPPVDNAGARVDPSATNVPAAAPPAGQQTGGSGSNPLLVVASEGAPAPYVANSAGTAVYAVAGDTDGSKCTGECTQAWPPMLVEDAMPSDSPGLDASMVGVVQRADGSTQVAYNGHPLYRYGADTGAGRTAGHGVSDKWGHWSLLSPQGERLAAEE
jgi:predicted lipoprotein with Yx(FWY)xxD motif